VARRHALRPGGPAVAHVQRDEEAAPEVVGVRFTAGRLYDQAQQVVIRIAVLESGADRAGDLEPLKRAGLAFRGSGGIIEVRELDPSRGFGQAAGLVQELPHRYFGGSLEVRHPEPGQITPDRGIQINPALFDELHHGKRRHRFREGSDEKGRPRGRRFSVRVRRAEAAQVNNFTAFNDGQRRAGYVQFAHPPLNVCIHGIGVRRRGRIDEKTKDGRKAAGDQSF
jgi:hypothetical protein